MLLNINLYYYNLTDIESLPSNIQLANIHTDTTIGLLITYIYRKILLYNNSNNSINNKQNVLNTVSINNLLIDILHNGDVTYYSDTINNINDDGNNNLSTTLLCIIHYNLPKSTTNRTTTTTTVMSPDDIDQATNTVYSLVTPELLTPLIEMGFPQQRATKALILSMFNTEVAIEWLFNHSDSPDVDVPLTQRQILSLSRVLNLFGSNSSNSGIRMGRIIGSSGLGSTIEFLTRSGGVENLSVLDNILVGSSRSNRQATNDRTSIRDRIQDCIQHNICTYSITGDQFAPQSYRCCYTCGLTEGRGVCLSCANVCHSNHDLGDTIQSDSFFCDCRENDQPCIAINNKKPTETTSTQSNDEIKINKYRLYKHDVTYNTTQPYTFMQYIDYIMYNPINNAEDVNKLNNIIQNISMTYYNQYDILTDLLQQYYNNNDNIKLDNNTTIYIQDVLQSTFDIVYYSTSVTDEQLLLWQHLSLIHPVNHLIAQVVLPNIQQLLQTKQFTDQLMHIFINVLSQPNNLQFIVKAQNTIYDTLSDLYDKQIINLTHYSHTLYNLFLLASLPQQYNDSKHNDNDTSFQFMITDQINLSYLYHTNDSNINLFKLFESCNDCLLLLSDDKSQDNNKLIVLLIQSLTVLFHKNNDKLLQYDSVASGLSNYIEILSSDTKTDIGKYAKLLYNVIHPRL